MLSYVAITFGLVYVSSVGGLSLALAHRHVTMEPVYRVASLTGQQTTPQSDSGSKVQSSLAIPDTVNERWAIDGLADARFVPETGEIAFTSTGSDASGLAVLSDPSIRPVARPDGLTGNLEQTPVAEDSLTDSPEPLVSVTDSQDLQLRVRQVTPATGSLHAGPSSKFSGPRYLIGVYR